MEVRIQHIHGKQSGAYARGHRVICDQPIAEGGEDGGMTPPELMLASLGTCVMHYVAEFLKARNLSPGDVDVRVSAEKGGKPVRLVEIGIAVDAPGLDDRLRAGLQRAAEACLLHRTLCHPPQVKIEVVSPVSV
jgi:uncharacterized OsmC-like protein